MMGWMAGISWDMGWPVERQVNLEGGLGLSRST